MHTHEHMAEQSGFLDGVGGLIEHAQYCFANNALNCGVFVFGLGTGQEPFPHDLLVVFISDESSRSMTWY